MRKTVDIDTLVDYVNGVLAAETDDARSKDLRMGAILVLEHALHVTGNYNGFRYLTNNELPDHIQPGVRYNANGILPYEDRFHNTDDTRRQYSAKCDTYDRWVARNRELA